MRGRRPALLVAVAAAVVLASCGDSTGIRATFNNEDDTLTVWAFNGTATTLPSAIRLFTSSTVRINAQFAFDVAFDLNAAGEVEAHSVRRMAGQTVATHRVGMQLTDQSFDEATVAPISGYAYDTTLVIPVGKVFFIDAIEQECSFSFLGANLRAKAVIDSVNTGSRKIYVHMLANRNCGFRSLVKGEPKD